MTENKENDSPDFTDTSLFGNGSIVKIIFHNFLTYDDAVCLPRPNLNLIIGPNGTGKSTIICGICLAVGGSPKLLGRSDSYGDFIKHGREEAFVELNIWDSQRKNCKAFRIQIKRPNSVTYYIDNLHKKRIDVVEEIKLYKIEVDNPCTFLAQDKVKSFAEQGIGRLLINTEKAGHMELYEMHVELQELSHNGENLKIIMEQDQRRLESLDTNIKTRRTRVENFLEQEKRHNMISLLKKKQAFIEYKRKSLNLNQAKVEQEKVRKKIDKSKRGQHQIEQKNRQLDDQCRKFKADYNTACLLNAKKSEELEEVMNSLNIDDKIRDASFDLNRVKERLTVWDQDKQKTAVDYERFQRMLEDARIEYGDNAEEDREKERLKAIQRQLREREQQLVDRNSEVHRKNFELHNKMNDQKAVFDRKLEGISRLTRNPGILRAWDFYENNKDKFRAPVYIPFLHMFVPRNEHLIYFNNIINTRDLSVFIFNNIEDQELMMKNGNPNRINAALMDDQQLDAFRHAEPLSDELKNLGFKHLLSELIDAPLPVTAFLSSVCDLNKIPIGGQEVENDYENIGLQIGKIHGVFLTNESRIEVRYSRYTGKSYVNKSILNRNFRLCGEHAQKPVDFEAMKAQIQRDEQDMKSEHERLRTDNAKFKKQFDKFKESMKTSAEKLNRVKVLETKVSQIKARLREFSNQKPDINAAEAAFSEQKRLIAYEALICARKLIFEMAAKSEILREGIINFDELSRLKGFVSSFRQRMDDADEKIRKLEDEYREKSKTVGKTEISLKAEYEELFKLTGISAEELSSGTGERLNLLQNEFAKENLPDTSEELTNKINDEEERLGLFRQDGTRQDVDDYESMKRQKAELEAELSQVAQNYENWRNDMDNKLNEWLTPLSELISRISDNFSAFFKSINCAGEINLTIPEDKYKLDEYGITIMVKFRDGNHLRPLNAQIQSGGERSISTMLYLMALQDLCSVPFRCVDEINQGMDPENERTVFNMMVGLLSGQQGNLSTTQYFMLTPKLLSGLDFNDKITVHIIHNGPNINNPTGWDVKKFLNNR